MAYRAGVDDRGQGRGRKAEEDVGRQSNHRHGGGSGDTPSRGHGERPASLNNFFSFGSKPLPVIPQQPPKRWTANDALIVEESSGSGCDTGVTNDDNKNYVEEYLNKSTAKLAQLDLHSESRRLVEPPEEALLGTIPTAGINSCKTGDAEVFWKFRMDERRIDTTNLAINNHENQITTLLDSNQVLIVEGFTGCGKTTQVPQFILDNAVKKACNVKIVVTQPRRIAAISVASRVCEERGWPLGSLIGYQVGMDRKFSDDTRVVYMTTGVLLQLLINKKNLTDYTHIIIDEVHERDLETDFLLLVIKKIIIDRRDSNTKVILMSATLDTVKFLKYFQVFGNRDVQDGISVVSVSQPSLYAVQELYLDHIASRYGFEGFEVDGPEEPRIFEDCYKLACKIIIGLDYQEYEDECTRKKVNVHRMSEVNKEAFTTSEFFMKNSGSGSPPSRGAVLVFLPGLVEIDTMNKQLVESSEKKAGNCNKPDVAKWTILPLHSSITAEEQQKVFKPTAPGFRKIILATNIAESSITVPDVKYVIDFCLTKSLFCDPTTNFSSLRMEWASRNQCIQRRGRCGRVAPGICYRLISESFYRGMPQEALPGMEKASLESVILKVKQLGMGCPLEVLAHAIDPPKQSGIRMAVSNLKEVGALTITVDGRYDAYDGDQTFMGTVMRKLPIDFRLGKLIVLGHVLGCVDDAVIIAAGLSTKSPFSHPYSEKLGAWLSKFGWSNSTYSDCFALLKAFHAWSALHRNNSFRNYIEEKTWARTYYVQLSVLREIREIVGEIKKRLETVGICSDSCPLPPLERGFILKLLIAGAFYPNYFARTRTTREEYERRTVRDVGGFNPLSSVFFSGFPIDQPGKLYEKHIAEKMAYTNCIPRIHFTSSAKVIVTFDPRGDKIGSISYGIYRAVKMNMLRDRVTFFTLPREDSKKAYEHSNKRLDTHRIVQAPKCVGLPSIKECLFDCIVCHVKDTESPHEFYVIRQQDEHCIAQVNGILNSDVGSGNSQQRLKVLPACDRQPGGVCIIVKDNRYLRCRIERLTKDQALVYAIDVGVMIWKPNHTLHQVTKWMVEQGLLKIPALAIPCRLSEVKPCCRHAHDWIPDAYQDFARFMDRSNNRFIFKVFSVVDGIVAGELYIPPLDTTINELFLQKTFVEKTTEPPDSIDNNKYRRRVQGMPVQYNEDRIKAADARQSGMWEPTRYASLPLLTAETGTEVTLQGPFSPLEMKFTSLCHSAHMKMVKVEERSVNCVALDSEPFNSCSRVMVAACVEIAHRSGNVMARETTIMPPISGLFSLLTMIFAPRIELRVDKDQTRYTGCVSGLGTDPVKGDPVYRGHDMEVIFDVNIDNDDLDLINSVRMTFNMLLRENSGQRSTLETLRENVRTELTTLLHRDREAIEETWPVVTHTWNRLKDVEFHHQHSEYDVLDNDVFSLHVGVRLKPPVVGQNRW